MFSFLNSSILFGLAAVAIPLIIHLLTRQKVKKIYFSSLLFLKELKAQKIRRIKIRQILLLIIRCLIVLLLLLAFARPTLKGTLSSTIESKANASVVIIFDNSMSMGREINGKTLFNYAKNKFKHFDELFKDGDQIYSIFVTPGSSDIYQNARYNFKIVDKFIQNATVTNKSTDIISAFIKAREILLNSGNLNKEIYLISDIQKSGFKNYNNFTESIFEDTDIKIFVIPCDGEEISNLGIISAKFANQIIEKGKVLELDVVVKNLGAQKEKNKLVQLFINGKRSAQAAVNLQSNESQKITFKIVPEKTGLIAGSVLLEDDNLTLDNRFYFTFYVPGKLDVLLIGNNNVDTKYLKIALDVSPNINSTATTINQINYGTFKNYDVIILSNIPEITNSIMNELSAFVKQGGGVITFLGSEVNINDYNANFNNNFLLPNFMETIGAVGDKRSFLSIGEIDFSHPVFKGMIDDDNNKQIESPEFYFALRIDENKLANNIIKYNNSIPLLLERNIEKGKVLLFNTALDDQWSNFYLKGIFVPLINRCIVYLAGISDKADRNVLIDQEIVGTIKNNIEITDLNMIKPDGSKVKLKPEVRGGAYHIKFNDTDLNGIYSLESETEVFDRWAINIDPDESNIIKIDEEKLINLIGAENITIINSESDMVKSILTNRYGMELWKLFLGAVLLLFLLEMFIGREKKYVKS